MTIFWKKFNHLIAVSLFIWLGFVLLASHLMLDSNYNYINNIIYLIESTFDLFIVAISWKIYQSAGKENKTEFLFLLLSYICCFLTDISFFIIFALLKINNPSNLYDSFYLFPFFGYTIFQLLFWYKITNKFILGGKSITLLLFILVNFIGILVFIVASNWKVSLLSYLGIYQIISGLFELVIFDLAALSLICSKSRGVYFLSTSAIVLIASNFWEKYLFLNQKMNAFDYSEFFWVLGLILSVIGLASLKFENNLQIKNWFRSLRGIKTQVTFWVFGLCVLSFLILCLLGYHFSLISKESFVSLPFLIMVYSVIVIILSNFIGNKFEEPFRKLQSNIETLMSARGNKENISTNFFTEEFIFLQKFLINAFELNQEKNRTEKAMNDIALQVAHDIRSPASAILMLAKEFSELPEDKRVSLRDAANRIQDISNNLLSEFQGKLFSDEQDLILVSTSILSVLSEKKVQYKDLRIALEYHFEPEAYFAFIKANLVELKRVISNLLNNAVESIEEKGKVEIGLYSDGEKVRIIISDTGKGMSDTLIKRLLETEQLVSDKRSGFGLGFSHAKKFLQKYNGTLDISSQINIGTKIALTFDKQVCPVWLAEKIYYKKNSVIVILDDDASIHGAWDSVFTSVKKQYQSIEIFHFKNAEECIHYLNDLSFEEKSKVLLLADYELINQNFNGLEVIEIAALKNAILVTSHYERLDIVKKAILLNAKILPKILAAEVQLVALHEEDTALQELKIDLVMLEDSKEFSDILSYLYEFRGKKLHAYHDPYTFLNNIDKYEKTVKICFDYSIGCPVNGIEFAQVIFKKGYKNLYLATGYKLDKNLIPSFLTLLNDKMDLLNL